MGGRRRVEALSGMRRLVAASLLAFASPAAAQTAAPTSAEQARRILTEAVEAAGGETWLRPQTLVLEGEAEFFAPDRSEPVSRATDYRMWRQMDPDRKAAHAADGKVRITARNDERVLFEVGFDGETTWTEKGVVPKDKADEMWASNFGFGIIRQALNEGFRVERAPDRQVGAHAVDLIRIIDPAGAQTLFGLDKRSRFIRYMGFATPRGWHERIYDDFFLLEEPRFLQAGTVTLFYNGVKQNTVRWKKAAVGSPLDPAVFAQPSAPD